MRLALEVVGVPEAAAGIEGSYTRMYIAAARQMGAEMVELRSYTVAAHLNGPTGATTLQQRSGNLARSMMSEVTEDASSVTGIVGVPSMSTARAYAKILHEGGTTRAHVIEAREGKSLAFMAGGRMIFRKLVNHPGSNFPPRPYLVSALEEQKAQIVASLRKAMEGALHE